MNWACALKAPGHACQLQDDVLKQLLLSPTVTAMEAGVHTHMLSGEGCGCILWLKACKQCISFLVIVGA